MAESGVGWVLFLSFYQHCRSDYAVYREKWLKENGSTVWNYSLDVTRTCISVSSCSSFSCSSFSLSSFPTKILQTTQESVRKENKHGFCFRHKISPQYIISAIRTKEVPTLTPDITFNTRSGRLFHHKATCLEVSAWGQGKWCYYRLFGNLERFLALRLRGRILGGGRRSASRIRMKSLITYI